MGKKVISFYGQTECPDCNLALVVKEIQSTIIPLEKDGKIIEEKICTDFETYLQCQQCGRVFEYICSPDRYKIETSLEQRLHIYNIIEKYIETKNNPFVKED